MTNTKRLPPRELGKMREQWTIENDHGFVDRLRERFTYDPATGDFRYRVRVQRKKAGELAGVTQTMGRLQVGFEGRIYLVHRLIWLMETGAWPVAELDHKDKSAKGHYANRWSNLREANRAQNMTNKEPYRPSQTGYRGVYDTSSGKYKALITANGKVHYLGTFETAKAAAKAYDIKALCLHSEFANLNLMPKEDIA